MRWQKVGRSWWYALVWVVFIELTRKMILFPAARGCHLAEYVHVVSIDPLRYAHRYL